MKTVYTEAALTGLVRRFCGVEPCSGSLEIERTDGIDLDSLIASRLRLWYADLLDRADPSLLVAEDISAKCTVVRGTGPGSSAMIQLPSSCRRPLSVRLDSWSLPAPVRGADELDRIINRQNNPFTAATNDRPVAVLIGSPAEAGSRLVLAWPYDEHDRLASVSGVIDPGLGTYIFDEKALSTLPDLSSLLQ